MIIGNPNRFAIESEMRTAFADPDYRGLGFFVYHVEGMVYGVRSPDATYLGLVFDNIVRRIDSRGTNAAPFSRHADGGEIISRMEDVWAEVPTADSQTLGVPAAEFTAAVESGAYLKCDMTRGLDDAFDDSSYVLQFDVGDSVRLVACQTMKAEGGLRPRPGTLRDVYLPADEFYEILVEWRRRFEAEWLAAKQTKGVTS